mmetsp:Transcript_12267/g.22273  ORF Transcript_12267/g.22273 Transcript_12267/m.22273 type:complete len:243 (+) Transcript_12267:661-1389(+)
MAPRDWAIYPFDRYEVVSCAGEGGICYNRGELVFAIASCENIATRFSKLGDVNESLESVVNGKGKARKVFIQRHKLSGMSDAGDPLCTTMGATACRNAHGVYVKKPPECSEQTWNIICSLSNAVHHVAKSITPIHDEISFVSKPDFEKLNHNLCHLMQKLHFPYGGMNIVFSGDMRQLEPFGEKRAVYQDDCPDFKDWVNCFIELTAASPSCQRTYSWPDAFVVNGHKGWLWNKRNKHQVYV